MPTILVTGATSGLGRVAATTLAREGHSVVIVGRDPQKTAKIAAEMGEGVQTAIADLERLDEVRRLAAEIQERFPALDVLVNNAGAMFEERKLTADGYERTFALNHLAPYLLTRLLLPTLKAAPKPRVVVVASDAHRAARIDLKNLQNEGSWAWGWTAYGRSKLANILFAAELARREPSLFVGSMHPGFVATNFARNNGPLVTAVMNLTRPIQRTEAQGADTISWLATTPEVEDRSGLYWKDRKEHRPRPAARDMEMARALWDASAPLVGLSP